MNTLFRRLSGPSAPAVGLFFVSGLVLAPSISAAELKVVSWNLRHEGWSGEKYYDADAEQIWMEFGTSATSPAGCDLVFLQEVMSTDAAAGITTALESYTGYDWSYAASPLVGRTTYKEMYAVVYRTDRVSIVSQALWTDTGDKFEREPYIVKVREKSVNADFTFIDWHTVFGTTTDRKNEITAMASVFSTVQSRDTADQDVILLGDHNMSATSTIWGEAFASVSPRVSYAVNDLTSLNSSGSYANAYDHFWFQTQYLTEYYASGRDYVPDTLWHVENLSDHAPIFLHLKFTTDGD